MGGQVIEERLPEDSLERRFATADGFVKLSERAPKKRCRQKQSCRALRLHALSTVEMFAPTGDGRFRNTPLTEVLRSDHPQQTFESGWVRAALGGEFSDRFRAAGKQVGNPQFRCGMNCLSDNNAGPDIFHWVSRHGSQKGSKSGTFISLIIVASRDPTRDAVLPLPARDM
jgi:hypothetical protein